MERDDLKILSHPSRESGVKKTSKEIPKFMIFFKFIKTSRVSNVCRLFYEEC